MLDEGKPAELEDPRWDDARVDVLGVGVSVTTMPHTLSKIQRWIESGDREYVCVSNTHSIYECLTDPQLREIHNRSGLTVPDGVPLVWSCRYAGAPASRVRGFDLVPRLCELASREGWGNYFMGAGPGTAAKMAHALSERFPGLVVSGTHSPPFREMTPEEDEALVAEINSSGAQILWVGTGMPKQERWMADHLGRVDANVMLGVGGAFDFHAGLVPQAPRWLRPTGLEWTYRLAREPRRLGPRYLRANPVFLAKILRNPPRLQKQS